MKNCHLNSNDLQSLARANVEGKLPQLRHLDISAYSLYQQCEISYLFAHSAEWNELTTLWTSDLSALNIDPGFLISLQELILESTSKVIELTRSWPHLLKLQLDVNKSEIYRQFVDGVERGLFPALEIFRYSWHDISASDLFKLYKTNISIEQISRYPYI